MPYTEKSKRRYRKRERARQEAETRRRITEAVVELHQTVGPANTKVTEVARRAGVGRQTVYNHFPTERDLIESCANHWQDENPFPDPERWLRIEDPGQRLDDALVELYAWYGQTEDMVGNVLRDAPLVAPLGELMEERWTAFEESMVDALLAGRTLSGLERRRVEALLRLAVAFSTWSTLRAAGLSDAEAAVTLAECIRSVR